MGTTWGSCSRPAECASRSSRLRKTASCDTPGGSSFNATVLSRRVSSASYTSPIPPLPINRLRRYGPNWLPTRDSVPLIRLLGAPGGPRQGATACRRTRSHRRLMHAPPHCLNVHTLTPLGVHHSETDLLLPTPSQRPGRPGPGFRG